MGILYELIKRMLQNHELVKEIDNLNSLAWKFRVNDSKKAKKFSAESAQLSREINYDNIGFTCFKIEKYDEAIKYFEKSLEITGETGDKKGEANTLAHLAEIYGSKKDLPSSVKFSNESLEIRKSIGDRRGEAEILLFLAELYSFETPVAEENKIYEWLTDALAISEKIKANDLVSKVRLRYVGLLVENVLLKRSFMNLRIQCRINKSLIGTILKPFRP